MDPRVKPEDDGSEIDQYNILLKILKTLDPGLRREDVDLWSVDFSPRLDDPKQFQEILRLATLTQNNQDCHPERSRGIWLVLVYDTRSQASACERIGVLK